MPHLAPNLVAVPVDRRDLKPRLVDRHDGVAPSPARYLHPVPLPPKRKARRRTSGTPRAGRSASSRHHRATGRSKFGIEASVLCRPHSWHKDPRSRVRLRPRRRDLRLRRPGQSSGLNRSGVTATRRAVTTTTTGSTRSLLAHALSAPTNRAPPARRAPALSMPNSPPKPWSRNSQPTPQWRGST